ncbi:MAG: TonB-dependent receptor [Bacteroidetes bacterium]|nr:TonB-dependent receptor [Bacteroidota bacterium]
MKDKCIFFSIFFFYYSLICAQTVNLSGWIKNIDNNKPLSNATILNLASKEGAISDQQGFFSLKTFKDSIDLEFSHVGFQAIRLSFFLARDTSVTIHLTPNLKLQTVEVIASESPKLEEVTALSTIELSASQINRIPTFLGEQDVLKVLQLLPSVQSGAEGQSGLQVRGGSPDQNLILLDGIPIYNPAHLFGFFSVFNGDIIEKVSFSSGGFPAKFAGRMSGIVDITTKKGSFTDWNTEAAVGNISGKLLLNGPIVKNKTSLLFSARRSLLDVWGEKWLNRIYQDNLIDGTSNYHFTDYNVKIFHHLNNKSQIFASAFQGKDNYKQEQERIIETVEGALLIKMDLATNWENFNSSVGWSHILNDKINSQFLVYLNHYTYGQERLNNKESNNKLQAENYFNFNGGIRDIGLKWLFQQAFSENHQLKYGLQLTHHRFFTGDYEVSSFDSRGGALNYDSTFTNNPVKALETGLFLEDEWEINPQLSMRLGFHLATYNVQQQTYLSFQPRLAVRAIGPGNFAYKFSFATMQQYLHLLTTDNGGFPTDLWLPATEIVRPQSGWIVAAQIARTFNNLELSIEPYYRILKNPIAYREGKSILNPEDWQQKITQGQGKMYGTELLLRKKTGKLNGWLAYTLSWSGRQFDALNNSKWYPYTYDRRHNLSVVANYQLGKHWRLSSNWVYYTGQAYSIPTHLFPTPSSAFPIRSQNIPHSLFLNGLNNFRFSDYHRLDISLGFIWGKQESKNKLTLGVYNAYDRKNAAYINLFFNEFIDADNNTRVDVLLQENSLYGLIPFVNLKLVLK